jgi:hypothetical protein
LIRIANPNTRKWKINVPGGFIEVMHVINMPAMMNGFLLPNKMPTKLIKIRENVENAKDVLKGSTLSDTFIIPFSIKVLAVTPMII